MKPLVFKYCYSYYDITKEQEVKKEFYRILTDDREFGILSPETHFSYEEVELEDATADGLEVSFTYREYTDLEIGRYEYRKATATLREGERIEISCIKDLWRSKGGMRYYNLPAVLSVEWLDDDGVLENFDEMKRFNISSACNYAEYLYKIEEYALAFTLFLRTNSSNLYLGKCYEFAYGTSEDIERAMYYYIKCYPHYDACRGIERIIKKTEGREIECDEVFATVVAERLGLYSYAYKYAKSPKTRGTNTDRELRRSAEIAVLSFLELGRPSNDPFGSPTPNMKELAEYFDMINGVPEGERALYYERVAEKDEYDGGYFLYDIYHDDAIVRTFEAEALKNDVLALGALLVQFPDKAGNIDDLIERLRAVADGECECDRGLANYFLGLYFERQLKDGDAARACFEKSLEAGLHYAVIHLAALYYEEDEERARELVRIHHPQIIEKEPRGRGLPYSARGYLALVEKLDIDS